MSTPIRAAFLDFDGTLGQMSAGHYALYVRAAEEHGVAADREALEALQLDDAWAAFATPLGTVHRDASASQEAFNAVRAGIAIERLRAAGVEADHATFEAIGRRVAELEEDPQFYELFDDTLPALERLAAARIESIVVSNHVWGLPEIVRALDGRARFEGVVTSARVGVRKPHPEIFAAAGRLTEAAPKETLMVGDSISADIEGGRAAGLCPVLIDRSGATTPPEGVPLVTTLLDLPLEWPA